MDNLKKSLDSFLNELEEKTNDVIDVSEDMIERNKISHIQVGLLLQAIEELGGLINEKYEKLKELYEEKEEKKELNKTI